jgi:hypothetical protein
MKEALNSSRFLLCRVVTLCTIARVSIGYKWHAYFYVEKIFDEKSPQNNS